uniref:Uncharacterized protein n=1 Tax=Picea glauca TaxID=3330 RepID=A0A117NI58_PICGL|nr:hypothetical protein ABT39_MTgene3992 [Picea glauca]
MMYRWMMQIPYSMKNALHLSRSSHSAFPARNTSGEALNNGAN